MIFPPDMPQAPLCVMSKRDTIVGVKRSWEIIAENLSKAGWSWGCVSAIDSNGRTSGLLTRIATTESVSLCMRMKS